MKILNTCAFFLLVNTTISCNNGKANSGLINHRKESSSSAKQDVQYDLSKPEKKWILNDTLDEISGIAWVDADHLLAIEDLRPNLYLLNLQDSATIEKTVPFKRMSKNKFDIEDVAINGKTAYALWSHGTIYRIDNWEGNKKVQELKMPLSKKNNTEGLCFDPVSEQLLIACKDDAGLITEKKSTKAVYAYDLSATKMIVKPKFLIVKKDFEKISQEKIDFNPSAIAVHPITHDIYMLSTKDSKCLARYSYDGQFKDVELFDRKMVPQPEGLCFAPDGTMYVSTEAKDNMPAAIYKFTMK
ncbi:MAG: SdiA-regulated domain-containing protein [Ginsengibacter sp.]